ncbi:cupin [Corticibacterium sp. UT-5YL-CI-8]|nr:cupin [Tianweitania sp. UT-5YL-CI-8]
MILTRDAEAFHFNDDGVTPNHPQWPLIVYRAIMKLSVDPEPAAILEDLFASNGWGNSWRDGIYDYLHYHSGIHEVLGIARGSGKVQFGGKSGQVLDLNAGDIAILPAGTGHQRLSASDDFLVVGAYPPEGTYDECTSQEDHPQAVKSIRKVRKPEMDPVYGRAGPLVDLWKAAWQGP